MTTSNNENRDVAEDLLGRFFNETVLLILFITRSRLETINNAEQKKGAQKIIDRIEELQSEFESKEKLKSNKKVDPDGGGVD